MSNIINRTVADVVATLDSTKATTYFRSVDRPKSAVVPARKAEDPEITKAKARLRTAAWRNKLDERRRPEVRDIGMALVMSLVTSPDLRNMSRSELDFIGRALLDLESRGYDLQEVKAVLKTFRRRLVDTSSSGDASQDANEKVICPPTSTSH